MTFLFYFFVVAIQLGGRVKGAAPWSYKGEDGPENWSKNYTDCALKHQSPIKIDSEKTEKKTLDKLKLTGYDTQRSGMTITNKGHTVQLQLAEEDENVPCIEGGGLGAKYCFAQLHFHWGTESSEGSEHIVDPNVGRALEAHFVHINPNEKKDGRAGIAVLGVTFQAYNKDLAAYSPITKALENVKYKGYKTTLDHKLSLKSLLPANADIKHFYRYNGSLTTPPCTEGVIWTVFQKVLHIGEEQMQAFRNLNESEENDENQEPIAPNNRPIQDLNGRTVYKT